MGLNLVASEIDLTELERLLENYEANSERHLIPLLQDAQEIYGYLPTPVLERVSEYLRVPTSQVYEVATFYSQFYLTPHGKNTIRVCRGTACHIRGGSAIREAVEKELGIEDGETTEDLAFSLETVACLGTCFLSPAMMVNDKYYGKLSPKAVAEILKQYQ